MSQQYLGSIRGGRALAKLRKQKNKEWSQLKFSLDTGVISAPALSNIESGKSQPSFKTLCEILTAMGATKEEEDEILKLFGYLPDTPLPDSSCIEAVVQYGQSLEDTSPFPFYIIDMVTRLFYWNAMFARLLGQEGQEILETMRERPLIQTSFERKLELGELAHNLHDVMLDETSMMYRRLQPFHLENGLKHLSRKWNTILRFQALLADSPAKCS
ncbi:MAG: helix-turn-helix domain-containing protein [Caldilineaceae bacterium]